MSWAISKEGRIERLIVFIHLVDGPVPLGELVFEGGGRERLSHFGYARSWRERRDAFPVAPEGLDLRKAPWASAPWELPLAFYDAAPDGWGRSVIDFTYPHQKFGMAEYLAAAGDDRTGALSFGHDPNAGPERWIPGEAYMELAPDVPSLEDIEAAAQALDAGDAKPAQLKMLFDAASDVGGARPKARVSHQGEDWIAKFRADGDVFDEPRVEAVCLGLAQAAGIPIMDRMLVPVAGRSVLLVRRFDRGLSLLRHPYVSAATIVGQSPVEYRTSVTYADMALTARRAGVVPCEREVFRRMLLDCFISNSDHHLRNTAFMRIDDAWRITPAFDVVTGREKRLVMMPAKNIDPRLDPITAFAAHAAMGIPKEEAASIYDEVAGAMTRLPEFLEEYELVEKDVELLKGYMPRAFKPEPLP